MFYRQRRRIPIYDNFYLDIIVSDDVDKINKATDSSDESYFASAKRTSFRAKINGKTAYKKSISVVLNPYDEFNPVTNKVMVHEANHVKNMVFQTIGYKNKNNNDEAEAYFLEWVFAEIEEFYNKVIKKEHGNNKEATQVTQD